VQLQPSAFRCFFERICEANFVLVPSVFVSLPRLVLNSFIHSLILYKSAPATFNGGLVDWIDSVMPKEQHAHIYGRQMTVMHGSRAWGWSQRATAFVANVMMGSGAFPSFLSFPFFARIVVVVVAVFFNLFFLFVWEFPVASSFLTCLLAVALLRAEPSAHARILRHRQLGLASFTPYAKGLTQSESFTIHPPFRMLSAWHHHHRRGA